jgi:hypothetical protein
MNANEFRVVGVKFKNMGNTTWTAGDYHLEIQFETDVITTSNTANLGRDVAPGAIASFGFKINTTSLIGPYSFQWRMHHGNNSFGYFSPKVTIEVFNDLGNPSPNPPPSCGRPPCEVDF